MVLADLHLGEGSAYSSLVYFFPTTIFLLICRDLNILNLYPLPNICVACTFFPLCFFSFKKQIFNFSIVSLTSTFVVSAFCILFKIFTTLRSWRYSSLIIFVRFIIYISHFDAELIYLLFVILKVYIMYASVPGLSFLPLVY